ncbi:methyl-accepting chemotaxis protein [Phaeovulum vinaykumarii]|uniref:Methyl-accepting chemotaxis protein n=1 Tax=Phaeovulum vinaykumarii TaxID=407234 RepID=A0A1N7LHP7_9RHOB|nr:methyl-accepting chemotaxis protein [Phaeovulum vinaykumarii]SIS73329.1 Methyl-accepting chemotaxis protein [Phaeovulum vinaykumarii]SOC04667.1 methyl-accepting chemotaxis protein [Phaeovulum vinaykumarii]
MRKLVDLALHGIAGRILLIVLSLAATTAAAVLLAFLVFQQTAEDLDVMRTERVPALRDGARVIDRSQVLGESLTEMLLASDPDRLQTRRSETEAARAALDEAIRNLPENARAAFDEALTQADARIKALGRVRAEEFALDAELGAALSALDTLSREIDARLAEMSDATFRAVDRTGQETADVVSGTFDRIVRQEFAEVRLALQVRSEINLLSGVAMALGTVSDPAVSTILRDLSNSALARLELMLPAILRTEALGSRRDVIDRAMSLFADITGTAAGADRSAELLSMRKDLETELAVVQDDLIFDLRMESERAASQNRAAFEMLRADVVSLRQLSALSDTIKGFIAKAFQVAVADDADTLKARQAELVAAAAKLETELTDGTASLNPLVRKLQTFAADGTGIAASRAAVLKARAEAATISDAAAEALHEVAAIAAQANATALDRIYTAGVELRAEMDAAIFQLRLVVAACAVFAGLAMLFAWTSIIRPLGRVSEATGQLARGNLEIVDSLPVKRGEIGMMTAALGVFRDGIVENARLQEEDRRQTEARAQAEAQALRDKVAREEAERQALAEAERREHEREQAAEAEKERLRAAAEAERRAQAEAQARVVTALANALRSLADGDLRVQIDEPFSDGYEQLRADFNEAVSTLETAIRAISHGIITINGGAEDIAQASLALSQRTETTAATLEESAAALTQITESVASSAKGAREADRAVLDARARAERSNEVVGGAVEAMNAIEDSSRKISTIIDVIDDIAFQTNLLALNAGVEAARAGEAGRGFAVVASEVRGLAQRSSEAAREIGQLISDSGNHVSRGVSMVGQVGSSLGEIVQSIENITQQVSAIAAAASEQSTGISEISTAVSQLDQATQQNAAMVEETTAAGQGLSQETNNLTQLVSRFSLRDDRSAAEADNGYRRAS